MSSILREITPLSPKDCLYIADRVKSEFTYPIHSHEEYELNFIERAAGVKRIVGDSIETIGDYDLVLITGKDLEHAWLQNNCKLTNVREITIQFSPDLFFNNFLHKNQFNSIKDMLEKAQNGISYPLKAIMKVYHLLDTIAHGEQGFYTVMKFLTILHELSGFTEVAKSLSSTSFAQVTVDNNSRRIKKVQQYIFDNYKKDIRLNQMADLTGMSPVAFSRFFKLRTGRSLTDYIIDIRLGHATRLLIESRMTVAEVCYDCGFNNISNFNRLFKKSKKYAPSEFRDNYLKKKVLV
jgi:AraC-like DNA-binding protein